MEHRLGLISPRTGIARCDDCRIERELFKDLVGPPCPHRPSATRRHLVVR